MKMLKSFNLLIVMISFVLVSCGGSSSSTDSESNDSTDAAEANQQTPAEEDNTPEEPVKTIVDLAVETKSLSTLVSALQAADLVETLSGEGPFTVFAPTNDAFAALPEGTLDNLLKPDNKEQLVAILTYHVVPGSVMSTDLTDGMTPETVNGKTVTISTTDGAQVNGANVVSADIEASNGVVHVIDAVILPPEE